VLVSPAFGPDRFLHLLWPEQLVQMGFHAAEAPSYYPVQRMFNKQFQGGQDPQFICALFPKICPRRL
jgi:hypothetical protein